MTAPPDYDTAMRNRLRLILKGKQLGFTLYEIKEMINAPLNGLGPDELPLDEKQIVAKIELLQRQRAGIDDAITELQAAQEMLAHQGGRPAAIDETRAILSALTPKC